MQERATVSAVCSTARRRRTGADGHGFIWQELVNDFKENEEVCSDMTTTMTSWAGRVLSCNYRQRRSGACGARQHVFVCKRRVGQWVFFFAFEVFLRLKFYVCAGFSTIR